MKPSIIIPSSASSSTVVPPRLYLGTMTFGWSQASSKVDTAVAYEMVNKFCSSIHPPTTPTSSTSTTTNKYSIDTARIYAGGKTEIILGEVLQRASTTGSIVRDQLSIGSKAHPSQPGGLSKLGIQQQFEESCNAIGVESFDEYYLHQPDPDHPLYDSLQILNEYYNNDKIKTAIGMSNYHVSEMIRAFELCETNNLQKPTVYQGLYNPLNRLVEDELLPILHTNNCSFVAYNPLAGGLLVDNKHTFFEINDNDTATNDNDSITTPKISIKKGRFYKNPNYIPRFYTKENFQALTIIQKACQDAGITMVEATYRWLLYHSALSSKDGILIGASSIQQLQQNLHACCTSTTNEPLPDTILHAFDEAWIITRPTAFPYWRSYSSDMPNREQLDPGASYDAAKTKPTTTTTI